MSRFWEDKPLEALDRAEWEALCDGCGLCCLHKLEDADSGNLFPTNVACKLLDLHSGRCSDYRHRRALVPDCLRLTPKLARNITWLPESCAYRLRAAGEPLPDWHPLNTGDPESVHRAGISVRGWTVSETAVDDLEMHILDGDARR
ncbi:YcgN family cysteine cluster protein [Sphingomonas flavalba]|uniref:YcgN family cysteine cluster protein n=1 Tax=Sphingomonas flavalba TaxID=2559804 RepID=UPI00109DBA30|nr:YcgN family cysteine cluster protein [Sphingomonas flavalba]